MDKIVQIIIGASVLLMAAVVIMFMFSDQTTGFSNFIDDQSQSAKCDLWESQYKNKVCEQEKSAPDLESKLTDSENDCGGTPSC